MQQTALKNKNSFKFLAASPLRFVFVPALPHLISTSVRMYGASFYHSLIIRHRPLWILISPHCVSRGTIRTQGEWCNITRILLKDVFPALTSSLSHPAPQKYHWLMLVSCVIPKCNSEQTNRNTKPHTWPLEQSVKQYSEPSPSLYSSCRFPEQFRWWARSTSFTQLAVLWHFPVLLMRQAWRERPLLRPATWQSLAPRASHWALIPIYPCEIFCCCFIP